MKYTLTDMEEKNEPITHFETQLGNFFLVASSMLNKQPATPVLA